MSGTIPPKDNKAIARRNREELWSTGNFALVDELYADDHIFHANDPVTPDFGRGPESFKKILTLYRTAFPDTRFTVEEIIAEGDKVVARWICHASHQGNLIGIAPTGKRIAVTGIDILHISGNKIKESWVNWDTMGMMQQLGVLPK